MKLSHIKTTSLAIGLSVAVLVSFQNCSKPGARGGSDEQASVDRSSFITTASLLPTPTGPVNYSNDVADWMDSSYPANELIITHAQTKVAAYDPQATVTAFDPAAPWLSAISGGITLQMFRSKFDRAKNQILLRKDVFDASSGQDMSFYGETFNVSPSAIEVRTETFFDFGSAIAHPAGEPQVLSRKDKFRVFANRWSGSDNRRLGQGRVFSGRDIQASLGKVAEQIIDTYACFSYDDFVNGGCQLYQQGLNDKVHLETLTKFDVAFDGDMSGVEVSPEFRNFDKAIVVVQEMNDGAGRERYFFAGKNGVYFGLVRWDSSVQKNGVWQVHARTIGLRREGRAPAPKFDLMNERAALDRFDRAAGLRVSQELENGQIVSAHSCPGDYQRLGTVTRAASTSGVPSQAFDLNGFNSRRAFSVGLCANAKSRVRLVSGQVCPNSRYRGAFFVQNALVTSLDSNAESTVVNEDWVALCADQASNQDVLLRFADSGCPAGYADSGSFTTYKDAYDSSQRRKQQTGEWMILCSK